MLDLGGGFVRMGWRLCPFARTTSVARSQLLVLHIFCGGRRTLLQYTLCGLLIDGDGVPIIIVIAIRPIHWIVPINEDGPSGYQLRLCLQLLIVLLPLLRRRLCRLGDIRAEEPETQCAI